MSGEDSVRSGNDGQKIAEEILSLLGWTSPSCNFNIDCSFPSRHKGNKKNPTKGKHGLDLFYHAEDPLIHGNVNFIAGSAKHFQPGKLSSNKSNIVNALDELSIFLECTARSDQLNGLTGEKAKSTKGILFFLSSKDDESDDEFLSLVEKDHINLDKGKFEEIHIIDNSQAKFLVSAVKTAERYRINAPLNFLYQNTGRNFEQSELLLSGARLPIQMMTSEIIPIIKHSSEKVSCLIFCKHGYSSDALSRLIWLAHKMCGLMNEILIYFPDYDANYEYEVNVVKQGFKDENLISKIKVHRWEKHSFISLKDIPLGEMRSDHTSPATNSNVEHSNKVPDTLDKILPFGDILIPKLKTSTLSEYNIKSFLRQKGIYSGDNSKDCLISLFYCLILSPCELDRLKEKFIEKENRLKVTEYSCQCDFKGKTLWENIQTNLSDFLNLDQIKLPVGAEIIGSPSLQRVDGSYEHLRLEYTIFKHKTNQSLLTESTPFSGSIEFINNNGNLKIKDFHSSGDVTKINRKYRERFDKELKKKDFSKEEFKSIRFYSFQNAERIRFLLSVFKLSDEKGVEILNLDMASARFSIDAQASSVPNDLESLRGKVEAVSLQGKTLNEIIYLSDGKYMPVIQLEKIKYIVDYKYLNQKGTLFIEIGFNGALKKGGDHNDKELQISIYPDSKNSDSSFTSTRKFITEKINLIRDAAFNNYSNKNSK